MTVLHEYSETSTWHGIKNWYKSFQTNSCTLKLFWTLIVFGAFAVSIYYNYVLILQYLSYTTASKITPTKVDQIRFPNVSLQGSTKLNKTYVFNSQYIPPMYIPFLPLSLNNTKLAFVNYMNMLTLDLINADSFTETLVETMERMYQNTFNKSVNISAVDLIPYIRNASVQCTEFVKKCWFDSTEFDCCSNTTFSFGAGGGAYQLNIPTSSDDDLTYQIRAGISGGLRVITELNKNIMSLTNKVVPFGITIFMDDYLSAFDYSPANVPAGMHALIRLNAVKYSFDPSIRYCLQTPEPVLDSFVYTKEICQTRCMHNMTLEMCGCRMFIGDIFTDPPLGMTCTPLQMLTCVLPQMAGTANTSQMGMEKASSCMQNNCPILCEYWVYSPSVTYSTMNQRGNDSNIVATGVTVFYGDMSYDLFEEALLMDFNTFISNLGNIYGLYTGISVLSLVQCAALCMFGTYRKHRGS